MANYDHGFPLGRWQYYHALGNTMSSLWMLGSRRPRPMNIQEFNARTVRRRLNPTRGSRVFSAGSLGGKFRKPKRQKKPYSQALKSGAVTKYETGTVLSASETPYLGHSFAWNTILLEMCKALIRRLWKKHGVTITSFDDTIEGVGPADSNQQNYLLEFRYHEGQPESLPANAGYINVVYNQTYRQTAQALKQTIDEFASSDNDYFWISLSLLSVLDATGTPKTLPLATIDLTKAKVHFDHSSSICIQNRTTATTTAGEDGHDAQHVDNNPVVGKVYEGKGLGTHLRFNNTLAAPGAINSDFYPNPNNGLISFDTGNVTNITTEMLRVLKRPPNKQESLPANAGYINVVYNQTYRQTAQALKQTIDEFASSDNDYFWISLSLLSVLDATGTPKTLPLATIDLTKAKVHFDHSSSICIQNRTTATTTAGEDGHDAQHVDNNPVVGKVYEGKGLGTHLRFNNTLAAPGAINSDFYPNPNNGLISFDTGNVTNITTEMLRVLKRPPNKQAFTGVQKQGTVMLNPGEMKTGHIRMRQTFTINYINQQFRNAWRTLSALNTSTKMSFNIGKFQFYGFEKRCRTQAADGVQKQGTVMLNPGEMKTGHIRMRQTFTINYINQQFRNAWRTLSALNTSTKMSFNIGKFQFYGFEKRCRTQAADEPVISIGCEINQIYRTTITEGQCVLIPAQYVLAATANQPNP